MPDLASTYIALGTSAFLAGLMNSIAGGGTLLTFPALFAALPGMASVANATSTIALMPGSLAGAWGYRKELKDSRRFVVRMLAPSFLGGLIGSLLLVFFPEHFRTLVPWLILTAATLFLVQQPLSKLLKMKQAVMPTEPGPGMIAVLIGFQFLVAVYGGYFGAGIGILMLTSLGFMGVGDIHHMNAVKTFLASVINAVSVVVFIIGDLIHWEYAAVMAVAAIAGGYTGARVARRLPAAYVRWAVIIIAFSLAVYYFVQQYNTTGTGTA